MSILRNKRKTAGNVARKMRLTAAEKRKGTSSRSPIGGTLLSLESRIMFDGAAVATVGAVTTEQIAQDQPQAASSDHVTTADTVSAAPTGEPQFTADEQALFDALDAYDTSAARQEVVFVSSSVAEYQKLLDGISSNVEVHILDSSRDGVQQMAEILAGRTNIDAIHLIGDGTEAEMHLGSSFLTQDSISTTYADQFQQIGRSLSANADLLIYGCNFGLGADGQLAMNTLAALTGADVAASTDRTGSMTEYGDWVLEASTGTIEASIVVGEATQAQWDHALATFTVTTVNDVINAGDGVTSLREAVIAANAAAGADTIVFNISGAGVHTINLTSALPTITDTVIIDGTTEPGYSGSLLIGVDGNGAGTSSGFVLGAGSSGSTITGLMITRFANNGILIDGSSNNVITKNYIGTDGVANLGNANAGIDLRNGAANNQIGGTVVGNGNIIDFNGWDGVSLESTAASGNQILGNSIYSNTGLGIDLNNDGVTLNDVGDPDSGANDLKNFPVLTSAQIVSATQIQIAGTYNSIANNTFRIEFFSSTIGDPTGYGEGQTYLGTVNVTTDASGNATFSTVLNASVATGSVISATATDQSNNDTSEFAQNLVVTNTAPTLDASKSPVLAAENEDAGPPVGAVGTLVSSLVDFAAPAGQVDNVTDPNSGALLGIAITAVNTTNGTWIYSTNGGTTWNAVGAVANNNALLLAADANTRLYFQPNANYNGTMANAITFRAWDQTTGTNGGTADTSTNGGTTAFSTATDTASLIVNAVNDAPINTLPASFTAGAGSSLPLSGLSIADVDALSGTITTTLSVSSGSLSAISGGGVTVTGSGTSSITLSGTLANINTFLSSTAPTFVSATAGSITLTMLTNDGGNTGAGGALSDSDISTILVDWAPTLDLNSTPANLVTGSTFGTTASGAPPAPWAEGAATGAGAVVLNGSNGRWDWTTAPGATATLTQAITLPGSGPLLSISFDLAWQNQDTNRSDVLTVSYNGVAYATFTTLQGGTANAAGIVGTWSYSNGATGPATTNSVTNEVTGALTNVTIVLPAGITASGNLVFTYTAGAGAGGNHDDIAIDNVQLLAADGNYNYSANYTENGAPIAIADASCSIFDKDNANVASATITLTNQQTGDRLLVNGSSAASGTLASGIAWTRTDTQVALSGSFTKAQYSAALQLIQFENTTDAPSTTARSINVTVNDGTLNSNTAVTTINVAAVNDAPVVDLNAGGAGNNVTTAFTEQTPVLIAPVGTLTDVDSANLSSLTVTLTTRPDGNAVESLSLNAAATAAASGAGLTVSYTPATGVLSITGAATNAVYQTILQGILYNDTSDTPTTSNRTITVVARDSTNVSSTSRTATITMTAVNDAPVVDLNAGGAGQDVTTAFTEQTPVRIAPVGTLTDVDSANLTSLTVTLAARPDGNAVESLSLNAAATAAASGAGLTVSYTPATGVLSITGAATKAIYQTILQGILYNDTSDTPTTSNRTITVVANDGAINSGTQTVTVTVTAVNDAPVNVVPGAQTVAEDTALSISGVSVTDVDGNLATTQLTVGNGSVTVSLAGGATISAGANGTGTLTLSGTQAQINAALGTISYQGNLNFNGADTLTVTSTDGNAVTDTDTVTLTVAAVNDAPVVDLNAGGAGNNVTTAFTEQTPVLIAPVGTLSDVDSANLNRLTVTLTARPDGNAVESLSLNAAATAAASGAGLTVSYTPATGVLSITGAATKAIYQTILQGILYNDTSDTPTTSNRTITVVANDGAINSGTQTVTVTVTAVNDAPVITVLADQTIAEDGTTGALPFSVSDVETAAGALTVTATSSNPALIPNGNLSLVDLGGGNWTIAATPAANQFGGPVTITVTVSDGTTTTNETFDVTITPVNDAPVITVLADQTIAEDGTTGALPFSVSDVETAAGALTVTATSSNPALIPNGNLSLVDLGGGNWTIAATPAANQFGGPVTITVTVSDGTTTTNETFDVTITPVNDAPVITVLADQTIAEDGTTGALPFSVSDVETAAGALTVTATSSNPALIPNGNLSLVDLGGGNWTIAATPAANQFGGPVTITVTVSDGTTTTNETFDVTITPVNDAPVITVLADQTIAEDGTTGALPFSVSDVETAAGALTVTATSSNPALIPNGNLSLVDLGGGNWTIAATPAANQFGGPVTITVTVSDGTTTTNETFDVTITPVNDAPVITVLADQTIAEDGTTGALPFSVSDVETAAGALTVTATSSNPALIPNGNLSLVDLGGGNWTIAATPAANQFGGPVTITVTVSDGTTTTNETFDVTITPVNDAPVITVLADQTIAEDGTTGALPFSVSDVETAAGALTVTATSSNPALIPNGNLSLVDLGGGNWTIAATPAANQFGGPVTITVTVSDGTTTTNETFDVTITPVNDAPVITVLADQTIAEDGTTGALPFSVSDVETAAGALTVTATSSNPALIPNGNLSLVDLGGGNWTIAATPAANQFGGPVTITVTVSDGTTTTNETFDVTITPVNDAPVITVLADQTIAEDGTTGALPFSVSDVETAAGALTVTATSSNPALIPNGNLSLVDLGGGNWTIAATPAANQFGGPVTITVTVSDGTTTTNETFDVTITPVNDAPTLAANIGSTVPRGGTDVVTTAELQVTDLDNLPAQVTYTVTVGPANGQLELTTAPGVAISSFTQAQIDAGLVVYVHNGSFTLSDNFTFTVSDGAGGNIGATTFGITVTPVNSIPILTTNVSSTVVQGLSDVITSGELQVTDLDNSPAQLVYTVIIPPVHGHLELTTNPGRAVLSFTQADINAGRLVFVHGGAVSPSDSFTFSVSDGAGGMIGATMFTFSVSPFAPPPPSPPLPPPTDPGPGPSPTPGPGPAPAPSGVTLPVLPPPPIQIQSVGAIDEPVKQVVLASQKFVRVEKPELALQEPLPRWLEPISMPVKKMLAVGHKLAQSLTRLADDLDRAMEERERKTHLLGSVASYSGIALSAGFVGWLLRSGSLLASFLVSMPVWRNFDPLPVLGGASGDRRKLSRKAREEQERENRQFRGIDKVLKPGAISTKPRVKSQVRAPKSEYD